MVSILESLTGEESGILKLLSVVSRGNPVEESFFHIAMAVSLKAAGVDKMYQFEQKFWDDVCPDYNSEIADTPYSDKLHKQVESLVKKGYITRDSENPIILRVVSR